MKLFFERASALVTRDTNRDSAHWRSGSAEDAQRQDDRTGETDSVARHFVEHQVLDLMDALLCQVVVMHAEGQTGQRVADSPAVCRDILHLSARVVVVAVDRLI